MMYMFIAVDAVVTADTGTHLMAPKTLVCTVINITKYKAQDPKSISNFNCHRAEEPITHTQMDFVFC